MNIKVFFIFIIFFPISVLAESNLDQWKDSDKTYKDLIDENYEIKSYDTTTIKGEGGIIILFFITVLQKENNVFECQEYRTLDRNMLTLDMSFMCRQLAQPFKKGMGT